MNLQQFVHNRWNAFSMSSQVRHCLDYMKSAIEKDVDGVNIDLHESEAGYDQSDVSWYYIPGKVTLSNGESLDVRFYINDSLNTSIMVMGGVHKGDYSVDDFISHVNSLT